MLYEKKTAAQAVLHFAEHGYKMEIYEMSGQRERDRVRKIIHDAKMGRVSDRRAKALLEKYGGDGYRISSVFEVAVTEGTGAKFKQGIEKLREELGSEFLNDDSNFTETTNEKEQ